MPSATSLPTEIIVFTASALLRLRMPRPMPVAVAVRNPPMAATWRTARSGVGPRRPTNRWTGQPRSRALRSSPRGRVGRTGVADEVEQLDVLAAVGVGEARAEVDVELLRELLDRAPLARAPQVVAGELTGELAVDHLEAGAEHVLDVEVGGHRLHLERQRRRRQHDGVALALVRGDQRARLGVDAPGQLLLEQLAAELVDLVDRPAAPRASEDRHDRVVVGLPEHEADAGHQRVGDLLGRHVAPTQPRRLQREHREPVDEGAVEVEERADGGVRRDSRSTSSTSSSTRRQSSEPSRSEPQSSRW